MPLRRQCCRRSVGRYGAALTPGGCSPTEAGWWGRSASVKRIDTTLPSDCLNSNGSSSGTLSSQRLSPASIRATSRSCHAEGADYVSEEYSKSQWRATEAPAKTLTKREERRTSHSLSRLSYEASSGRASGCMAGNGYLNPPSNVASSVCYPSASAEAIFGPSSAQVGCGDRCSEKD